MLSIVPLIVGIWCAGTGDWHNLQLSGAFGVKPGLPDISQGSRSRYISDVYVPFHKLNLQAPTP